MTSPTPRNESAGHGERGNRSAGAIVFGLVLTTLIAAAIVGKVVSPRDASDIVKICAAVASGILSYFISGSLVVDPRKRGFPVRASAGFGVFAVVVWLLFLRTPPVRGASVDPLALNCSGLTPSPLDAKRLHDKTIQIGILESGDLAYVRNIEVAFQRDVKTCADAAGFSVDWEDRVGPTDSPNPSTNAEWDAKIRGIKERLRPDYWVPIGTQAAVNLKRVLGNTGWGSSSVVFAGITDPVCSDLVSTRTQRTGEPNVGGSQYGGDPKDYLSRISQYFPGRKIVFIYDDSYPQDACFAEGIASHPLVTAHTAVIQSLHHRPTLSDLPDAHAVYFSWYTFEAMFEDDAIKDILKNRIVVSTTRNNVLGPDLAPLGVVGNDTDIGEHAAHALLKDLFGLERLSDQDVEVPKFLVVMNCETASHRGLQFPVGLETRAQQVTKC